MSDNRGWYPDRERKNRRRYWDGRQWGQPKLTPLAIFRRALAIAGATVGGIIILFIVLALVLPSQPTDSHQAVPAAPGSSRQTTGATPSSTTSPAPATPTISPSTSESQNPTPSQKPSPARESSATNRPSPSASATTSTAPSGSALAAVATLTVKGRAPKTGYSREQFGPAWADVDHNGCRQRDDVLNRDLTDKTFDGCEVLTGVLHDPYTGATINFRRGLKTSSQVQIDHVVALSDAWQKGAQQWSADKRRSFANDTLNLLAVGQSVNESKGDGDTATWLPPNKSYRCAYVARQVAVKKAYGLWVTSAERDAMRRVLSTCPTMKLPTRTAIPGHPAALPQTRPAPPPPRRTTNPNTSNGSGSTGNSGSQTGSTNSSRVVHPGAFCSPVGAQGVTVKGTPMTCSTKPGDSRARWRSAG